MVRLIAVAQATQDGDGIVHRGFGHVDRLEAALERRVALDVFLVLAQGGRAYAAELAARERRLEDLRGVHGALAAAGADDRVDFVDE